MDTSKKAKPDPKSPGEDYSLLQLLRAFLPHLPARRKRQFGLLLILMLIGAAAELVTIGAVIPFIALLASPERAYEFEQLQRFFSALGWNDPESLMLPMSLLFIAIVIASAAIRLLLVWSKNRYMYALGYDIGVALYRKVLDQPYDWHIAQNSSSTIAAVTKVQIVVSRVLKPMMEAIIGAIMGTAIIIALLMVDAPVAITAGVIFATFYLLVIRFMRWRLRRNSKIIASAQTLRVKAIQEGLGGIRDVLLDHSQAYYRKNYAQVDQRLRTAQATNAFIGAAPRYIIEPLGICLIVALAVFLASTGDGLVVALPTLGALALGAQRLLPTLQQLYLGWSKVMGNRQIFADVLEYLELNSSSPEQKARQAGLAFDDKICFEQVCFKYAGSDTWALDHIDLVIPRGSRVGIAGSTGSGKSTLMDILMGLLEPTSGRVSVDNTTLTESNRHAWQRLVAHVPQFIYLADASIAENIAFGVPRKQIDFERVKHAAEGAQIAEFIESREGAYEAKVGERGIQLSGGQRQRIGIARALYKDAEVLVFDEATSALDDETEEAVMTAIESLSKDLTIIMIAHRVSTLKNCDYLLALSQGKIQQMGSYDELFGQQTRKSLPAVDATG